MRRFGGLAALAALGALSAATYAGALSAAAWLGVGLLAAHHVVVAVLFVLYLAAAWLVSVRILPTKKALAVVLGFGLLFRALVLPTPVYLSSDLFRYLWDGRVQLAGVNPYRYAPSAPELAHLRDGEIHPRINRPAARTIYPPAAQWLFALAAALAPGSIVGWRLLLLLFDGATVAMLLLLLRRLGVPPTAVIIYAWSPLVVFEGVQAGHVEAAMIPLILLALLLRQTGSLVLAGVALGVAVLMKLYPAVLLPAWWRRDDRRDRRPRLSPVRRGARRRRARLPPRVPGEPRGPQYRSARAPHVPVRLHGRGRERRRDGTPVRSAGGDARHHRTACWSGSARPLAGEHARSLLLPAPRADRDAPVVRRVGRSVPLRAPVAGVALVQRRRHALVRGVRSHARSAPVVGLAPRVRPALRTASGLRRAAGSSRALCPGAEAVMTAGG